MHNESQVRRTEAKIMKLITIRNLSDEVKKTVQKEAARKGVSLNKAIISLLEGAVGSKVSDKKKRVLYHDLDHLAGLWSREEASEFDENLKTQRKVDARLNQPMTMF
jgi:plasmid stability protein